MHLQNIQNPATKKADRSEIMLNNVRIIVTSEQQLVMQSIPNAPVKCGKSLGLPGSPLDLHVYVLACCDTTALTAVLPERR